MKIVSLLPSATEIVFALGLGDDLEGVTYECDFPAEARSKPVVSETALPQDRPLSAGEIDRTVGEFMARNEPIYTLNKELIQKIQPDLILALGVVEPRALVVDGKVEARLAVTLSLSFDHRVLDGAEAGRALRALGVLLESPFRLGALPR